MDRLSPKMSLTPRIIDGIVHSPFPKADIPNLPVHTLIFQKLKERGSQVVLIDGVTHVTYTANHVRDMCLHVARGLSRLGVRQGETVSLFSGNSVQFMAMTLGVMAAGAIVNTVNCQFKEGELEHQLIDVGASWVYTTLELLPCLLRVAPKLQKLKRIIVDKPHPVYQSFDQLCEDVGLGVQNHAVANVDPREEVAAIVYSSGTSGLPKGVMLTHRNLIAYSYLMGTWRTIPNEDRELIFLPLYHVYALANLFINGLINSIQLVLLPGFKPGLFFETIQRYKITSLPLVPPIVVFMAKSPLVTKYDLTSLNAVWCGAAPLGVDTEALFEQRFPHAPIRQGWGLTETTGSGLLVARKVDPKPGAAGLVVANTEIKVVDISSGRALPRYERGEIMCRGPTTMKGYLNNEDATKRDIDPEGWLHTGDVGYYDEEGFVYIVDRIKELIKYKGSQVAPAELEALILGHPSVSDVGVIGIPDREAGEVPRAFVVLREGTGLTEADLMGYVAERVADFKQLRGGVIFMDVIPKSSSGKILRRNLRQLSQAKL